MKASLFTVIVLFLSFTANGQIPGATNMPGADPGGVLETFVSDGLSPDAMTEGFNAESFLKDAGSIADAASLGKHVNKLIGFIKPGMFKEGVDVNELMDVANSAKSLADAAGVLRRLEGGLLPKALKSDWAGKSTAWHQALDLL